MSRLLPEPYPHHCSVSGFMLELWYDHLPWATSIAEKGHHARDTSGGPGSCRPFKLQEYPEEPDPIVTDRELRPENSATLNSGFPKLVR